MGFSKRVLEMMSEKDIAKSELARAIGIPYTTLDSMLKRDSDGARIDIVFRIASTLGVSVEQLVYGEKAAKQAAPANDEERILLGNFRKTDARGKSAVLALSEIEAQNVSDRKTRRARIPVYDAPAAAGAALPLLSDGFTLSQIGDIPEKANFGIRISGDSMEPAIADGSVVWVQRTEELFDGEIGIFLLNGESLCKKLNHEGKQCSLVSLNSAYAPIRVLDTDELKVVGRVLLK
ncbi:MAG: helix-turn-helix domain-containing protein [Clostridia bacterium]|nr:helix-turn-helix domain-containing protein [Clostridia bacterium]